MAYYKPRVTVGYHVGKCSHFGGPEDTGVKPGEGLAFWTPALVRRDPTVRKFFLPTQPTGTTGLARRLNPEAYYVACPWDYQETPPDFLRHWKTRVRVRNPANGAVVSCRPMDWGPHHRTGRHIDLSPGAMRALGATTDDELEFWIPAPDRGFEDVDLSEHDEGYQVARPDETAVERKTGHQGRTSLVGRFVIPALLALAAGYFAFPAQTTQLLIQLVSALSQAGAF